MIEIYFDFEFLFQVCALSIENPRLQLNFKSGLIEE